MTAQKLNIAKGEWALKQSKAQQSAQQAEANASVKSGSGRISGSQMGTVSSGSTGAILVPYSAARLRSQGRSDSAIRSELQKEGYSDEEIRAIFRQMSR